jgi:mono/diheme cytochrome c family protein
MRHHLRGIVTIVIGALLVFGSAIYAWARSAQIVISDEDTVIARHAPAEAHAFEWQELGARSYKSNCQNCHGQDGRGWDQYPGLIGTNVFAMKPEGRAYFVALHLYGLTSKRWRAPMPPMGHMKDVELAAVMNHVLTSFGNNAPADALFLPEEIGQGRGQQLRPRDVEALR